MAANKIVRFGPSTMVTGATGSNLINPSASGSTAVGYTNTADYVIVRHIRLINTSTTGALTASLYIGATTGAAAGTEFLGSAQSIAASSAYDWYGAPGVRLDVADFLTGRASAAGVTFEGEGEVGKA